MAEKTERATDKKKEPIYAGVGLILGSAVGFFMGGPLGAAFGAAIGLILGAGLDTRKKKEAPKVTEEQ